MRFRLFRFGAVGMVATAIHSISLLAFTAWTSLSGGVANLSSFLVAFFFSVQAQQHFTFRDRLGTQRLNSLAVFVLFMFNAAAAALLGDLIPGWWRMVLPLVPAVINYLLFYALTGMTIFRQ
jgi:putative flippase GtrA